jgi:hypothetical protein
MPKKIKYTKAQLEKGAKHELEHTKILSKARKIAKDHLEEHPDYYVELSKMEKKLKKREKKAK